MKSFIIAVSGGSGSGKTTFSKLVQDNIVPKPRIISVDNYYRDLRHLAKSERAKNNFDDPASIEWEILEDDLQTLSRGNCVDIPTYSFKTHTRMRNKLHIKPGIILLEGIFSLYDPRCNPLFDMRIYVDTDEKTRLARRIKRDVAERSRTVESIILQWNTHVKPMHDRFVEPTKKYADIIIRHDDYMPCIREIQDRLALYVANR